ncbi:MAG: tRNA uridine-5-carboxymethylaminomethyl(34) synthesis GTPase MnmE [Candidatus Margulisiibacteriota bacterium]|jgi:tRNA modification GTPase
MGTIVAAASKGAATISIIRLSGPKSLDILSQIFPKKPIETHRIYHGWIIDPETMTKIDEVMAWYLQGPSSFTGEDMVEISCHGSQELVRQVVELIVRLGGRGATKGEFTKRAFLNGKIDLTQAEAIVDLITAKTEKSASSARKQVEGKLKGAIKEKRRRLLDQLSAIEAEIDFPDDVSGDHAIKPLEELSQELQKDINTANYGKIIRNGVKIAIIGRPNVGKSSLLNRLLKEERAIVTDLPGTTRDTIEETINIQGLPFILIDTAGIRETKERIEELGINRTKKAAEEAEVVLVLKDATDPLNREDETIMNAIDQSKAIVVYNKVDLAKNQGEGLAISATKGTGIDRLEAAIINKLAVNNGLYEEEYGGINERHKECLIRAHKAVQMGHKAALAGAGPEEIAVDIKEALVAMGEITGEEVTDEVLNNIFDKFCIGK